MDTDPDEDGGEPSSVATASQAGSHFPLLRPASGATLFGLEVARRANLNDGRGRLRTGCAEVDDETLLGGFERGAVVGVSAEGEGFGMLVGLQTVAHAMVFGTKQRAAVITTLAAAAVLPTLRDVIRAQAQIKFGPAANQQQEAVDREVRRCLEQISVSRVFDVEGLWEVLNEIEAPPPPPPAVPDVVPEQGREQEGAARRTAAEDSNLLVAKPPILSPLRPVKEEPLPKPPMKTERTEIGDSEDEDEELSLDSSPPPEKPLMPSPQQLPSSTPPAPPPMPAGSSSFLPSKPRDKQQENSSNIPDIILITHFSTLLTNLFTRSADNKASAHTTLQLLSSHLRYLARSSSGPLIMLLNSTTPAGPSTSTANTLNPTAAVKNRPLEPTLRSIFTSASPPPPPGAGAREGSSNQRKPAFGATFAQFLDLHLLCTQVPRTRADAETLFAPPTTHVADSRAVRSCWVVEVLLDELGTWEWADDGNKKGGKEWKGKGRETSEGGWIRRSREQRWGAVDVRAGVRVVDALPAVGQTPPATGSVRLAAGFGGPPLRGL
ncbi:hypothetical protein GGS26DRAFT_427727 [Hypomontagnella submonticulosa]|nr:hypothetical protein GGS26DRAFT_427727 [Hypomontagnella submonticulosa]